MIFVIHICISVLIIYFPSQILGNKFICTIIMMMIMMLLELPYNSGQHLCLLLHLYLAFQKS